MKLLKKKVFDINKVTVVGSPTITSDGVASGFSGTNYCYTPIIINPQSTVKFVGRFTMPINTVNAYGAIFYYGTSSNNRFWLQRTPENNLQLASVNGSYRCLSKTPLTLGTIYDFEAIYTNGLLTLKYKSQEDKDFIEVTSNQTGILGSISSVKLYLGVYDNGNTPFTGSIDLSSFKVFVDDKEIYNTLKPTYLMEKRKPKVWNKGQFTIVGNPSISDNGIASGFSGGNSLNFNINLNGDVFKIISKFKTPNVSNRTNFSAVWQIKSTTSIGLEVVNQQMMIIDASGSKTAGQFTYEDDTEYEVIWEYTISNGNWVLNYKKVIDIEFTTKTGTQVDYTIAKQSTLVNIGTMNNYYYFTGGQIDLKQFKIYADNNLVFDGEPKDTLVFDGGAETYAYDPSKFTIIGSPTITEYGVLVKTANNNGVNIPLNINSYSNFNIKLSGKVLNTNSEYLIYLIDNNGNGRKFIKLISGDRIGFWQISTTGSWSYITIEYTYKVGDNIDFEIVGDGTNLKIYTYINNVKIDKLTTTVSLATIFTENGSFYIRNYYGSDSFGAYQYNLPAFAITVDGKEVFTGAKEVYYMFK